MRARMPWQMVNPKYYGDTLGGRPSSGGGSAVGGASPTVGGAPKATQRGFGLHGSVEVHGHERALWYHDTSPREQGELVLHIDEAGALDWFQLTHTKWPHGREHVAEWKRGTELHLGSVASESPAHGAGGYRASSPTITRYSDLPHDILLEMTDYFLKHAQTLEEEVREGIARVLWGAMQVSEN